MTQDEPRQVLGVAPEAGDEEIRAAYLRKVKEYPPDRAPREFEKVRDAYEILRDRRRRTRQMMLSADPKQSLTSLLDGRVSQRRYVGPEEWFAVLHEPKSAQAKPVERKS